MNCISKEKNMLWAIGAVLAMAVLSIMPSDMDLRLGKQIIAELSVMCFIACFFIKNKYLRIFLLWNIIRTFIGYNRFSYITLNTTFIYLMFLQMYSDFIRPRHFKRVLDIICAIAMINCMFMVMQYLGLWVLVLPKGGVDVIYTHPSKFIHITQALHDYPLTGLMSNTNMTASLLAVSLPAFMRREWIVCLPLVYAMILKLGCMGGIIPAGIITMIFLWKYSRLATYFFMFYVILGVWYVLKTQLVNSERWEVWHIMVTKLARPRWIIGWGVGQFKVIFPVLHQQFFMGQHAGQRFLQAHNEYLQLFIELGAIGFTAIAGYLAFIWRKILKNKEYVVFIAGIGLLSAMINSGCNFLFHTTTGIIVLAYLGIIDKGGLNHV